MTKQYSISDMLSPKSVAVIGASEDQSKYGGRLFKLLVQHGYSGTIYPINRKSDSLFGIPAYASVADCPTPPDMVVMAVPRDHVKTAVRESAEAGAKAGIIITAQFSDAGPEGARLEAEIVAEANAHGMRLIGPNCLGIISPASSLVLCASPSLNVDKLRVGRIGLISQSGGMMATLADRARTRGVGFSSCFSIGNQADLEFADFIDYLVDDPDTDVICAYIEGIKDGPRFAAAAERARLAGKPVLAVKAGRTASGAAAAFSHTASLAGGYEAFAAVCRETAVVPMDDPDAMVMCAAALVEFGRPDSVATTIVSNSGGGGVVSTDRVSDLGFPLTAFDEKTVERLSPFFPGDGAKANPIDMGASPAGGSKGVCEDTAHAVLTDSAAGLVIAPFTTAPDIRAVIEGFVRGRKRALDDGHNKPLLIVFQSGTAADEARQALLDNDLFFFNSLDEALRVAKGYEALLDVCPPRDPGRSPGSVSAGLPSGAMDEASAKAMLAAYGVSVNRGEVAADAAAARAVADRLTGPFVVKVMSPDIVHKSDAGGVVLSLPDAEAVSAAVGEMSARLGASHPEARIEGYLVQEMVRGELEMFVGARRDPIFGPVVMAGAGGVMVELLRDVAVRRAPVSREDAADMVRGLKVGRLIDGFRGSPALDLNALADTISRVSWLAHDLGTRFAELDVNPVLVREKGQGCTGVDARILLADD